MFLAQRPLNTGRERRLIARRVLLGGVWRSESAAGLSMRSGLLDWLARGASGAVARALVGVELAGFELAGFELVGPLV